LRFGVYTADKASDMVRQFRPLLDVLEFDLSEQLGEQVRIRMEVATDYESGREDLLMGRIDFARFGPASFVLARQENPHVQLLAMEHKKGEKQFFGVICAPSESAIMDISDLKNKRFAFGNETSTIGRYLAQQVLVESGIHASDLARWAYLGRHDLVGTAVAAGNYDAGAIKEATFLKLVDKGLRLKELARFPNVTKPWVARPCLPDQMTKQLRQALLNLDDEQALAALGKSGFLPAGWSDYQAISSAMEGSEQFFRTRSEP